MARITRTARVSEGREAVWDLVSDPQRLPAWWPRVERVEDATETQWTTVMRSAKGRAVRLDYTLTSLDAPASIVWSQEIEESPFERILSAAETTVALAEAGPGETAVSVRADLSLRGFARFGQIQVRRAWGRQLDDALGALGQIFGTP